MWTIFVPQMIWQHTPYNLPLAVASAISLALTIYIWQRRSLPGAFWLFVVMCGVDIWAVSYSLQMASAAPLYKGVWNALVYFGILIVPTGWLAFSLDYTGRGEWFLRRAGWFAIVPLVTLLILWTNSYHHMFWSDTQVIPLDGYVVLNRIRAIGFWVHAIYSYALLLIGNVLLLRGLLESPSTYRTQFVVVLVGSLAPWAANALTIFQFTPYQHLDLTPFAFCITGLSLGWGLYRFRLLDLRPLAIDLAVERMRDGLLVLDDQATLVELNSAARSMLRSMQVVEPIGLPVVELLPGLANLLEQPGLGEVESMIAVDIYGAPRSYEAQRISMQPQGAGWLIVLHDITARQRTENRLRQLMEKADAANKAKSHFLAHMNHELRNPLTSLMGHAEMLQMQLDGHLNKDQLASVGHVLHSSELLLAMINESLDMSRIEAGRVTFYPESFAVGALVEELADHVRPLVERNGSQLRLDLSDGGGEIHTDRVKTRQCLLNLLTNAAKFTTDGEVALAARYCTEGNGEATWQFDVSDTGIGIPSDRHEVIFESFSQASDETASRHGGTGLGLTISRSFARMMGGDIKMESTPGEGSRFSLHLPARMPSAPDA
jgi:signal transduction histidine kinase